MSNLSNRKYKAVMLEQGETSTAEISLGDLLEEDDQGNNWEYIYTLQEHVDEVLDLKVGDSAYFQPNRDNKKSKGFIYRVV